MCAVMVYKCSKGLVDFKQELLVLKLVSDSLEPVKQLLFPVFLKAEESKKPFACVALDFRVWRTIFAASPARKRSLR